MSERIKAMVKQHAKAEAKPVLDGYSQVIDYDQDTLEMSMEAQLLRVLAKFAMAWEMSCPKS